MNQGVAKGKGRKRVRRYTGAEGSLGAAAAWSVLVVLAVAIAIVVAAINIPGTALNEWWLMVTVTGVNPSGELYQRFWGDIAREEALFVTPFSLLCGGVAFGRLAPPRLARLRTFAASAGVALAVLLVCLAIRWGIILYAGHGRLQAGQLNMSLALIQFACILGWVMAFLLGTQIGVLWRAASVRLQTGTQAAGRA